MRIYLWILIFFLPGWGISQVSYSNEFLNIGVGARSHGMSGSVTASVSDVNAGYWNPAGLTNITDAFQLGAMHAEWFGGVGKFDHLSIARKLNDKKGVVAALSMVRLGIDQIPNTLNLVSPDGSIRFDNVSEFSATDYAFLLSYARIAGKWDQHHALRFGGNAKIIHRVIGPFAKAWGFGLDLGLQYQLNKFYFGLVAKDLTTTFTGWRYSFTEEQKVVLEKTGNIIPVSTLEKTVPRLEIGSAYSFGNSENISLRPELGLVLYFDGKRNTPISSDFLSIEPKLGIELAYKDLVFLRSGFGNIQKVKDELDFSKFNTSAQLNFGLGLKLGKIKLDYALANIGNLSKELSYSHIFSATLGFSQD